MTRSDNLNELAAALAKAQAAMRPVAFNATNPDFHSRYATLAAVVEALREPLTSNGLAVTQVVTADSNGQMVLVTMLLHTSGQFISGVYPIKPARGETPQDYGSALTYARRYALAAITGAVADEDDDGNAASAARPSGPSPETRVYNNAPKRDSAPAASPVQGPVQGLPFRDQGTAVQWAAHFSPYQKPDGTPDFGHITGSIRAVCKQLGCVERDVAKWGPVWYTHVLAKVAEAEQTIPPSALADDEDVPF